jgi:hypothetical protein
LPVSEKKRKETAHFVQGVGVDFVGQEVVGDERAVIVTSEMETSVAILRVKRR